MIRTTTGRASGEIGTANTEGVTLSGKRTGELVYFLLNSFLISEAYFLICHFLFTKTNQYVSLSKTSIKEEYLKNGRT